MCECVCTWCANYLTVHQCCLVLCIHHIPQSRILWYVCVTTSWPLTGLGTHKHHTVQHCHDTTHTDNTVCQIINVRNYELKIMWQFISKQKLCDFCYVTTLHTIIALLQEYTASLCAPPVVCTQVLCAPPVVAKCISVLTSVCAIT